MSKFSGKPEEVVRELDKIRRRNDEMMRQLRTDTGRALQNAGQVVEARAKEIISEKGHIVTGTLRRSINTQVRREGRDRAVAEVGSFMVYAPSVEALDDGGYLNPALEQRAQQATKILIDQGIQPALKKWGR